MSLLTPAFLAGLGLLLVPIIIHLTQRQRSEVTAFPSLMFLRRVPFRTSNRRRIRHPLLFALRCLAIALLVLAFTRPFARGAAASAEEGSRDVVLVLDTSASLAYGDRWSAAIDEAASTLDGLGEGDRAALVTFSEEASERVALTGDLLAVRAVLGELEPGDLGTRLESGIQLAGRILSESDREVREVVLVSDFQRSGWEDEGRVRLPDGVTLTTRSLADDRDANLAVADVRFTDEESGRVRLVARIANMGDEAAGVPVSLELGGRTVATREVEIEGRGAATVAFDGVALPEGGSRGRLTLSPDALTVDDALHFLATPDPPLEVLVLEGSRGRTDRSLYLERALAVGESPRARSSRRPASQLDAAWLATAGAVILNDAALTGAGPAGRLVAWVEAGGGLVVVLGSNADPGAWSAAGEGLLGVRVREVEDRTADGGARLAWLDYDHPVFELFSTPRSGDFSEARFFRFHGVEPLEGTRVLARFEGGEPALLEHAVGDGRVLVWTSSLDRFWNDLALQPVFLPFVHRVLRHVTRYREPERWVTAGGVLELGSLVAGGGAPGTAEGEWVLVTPSGDRRPIEKAAEGPTWIPFEETGFYQVEPLEGGAPPATVAVNASLEESDLAPVPPERVVEAVVGAGTAGATEAPAGGAADPAAVETEGRRELWWPVLLLAALVLVAESLLANRWTRRRPSAGLAQST